MTQGHGTHGTHSPTARPLLRRDLPRPVSGPHPQPRRPGQRASCLSVCGPNFVPPPSTLTAVLSLQAPGPRPVTLYLSTASYHLGVELVLEGQSGESRTEDGVTG